MSPTTEHEWTVHSINIHGVFFERWCQRVIASTPGWTIDSTNYPVEFPPPNGPARGKESTLDIRASSTFPSTKVALLVECKKNNPDYVNWVFFQRGASAAANPFVIAQIENTPREPPASGWNTKTSILSRTSSYVVCDEARETRGDYLSYKNSANKTKTSNSSVQDAAYQIALATQAIVNEEASVFRELGFSSNPPTLAWLRKLYLPAIVTTARLFTADFDPKEVHPRTGEIPAEKVAMTERPQLVYEYPLPRHLQFGPSRVADAYGEGLNDLFTRLHILLIQSESLPALLTDLMEDKPADASKPLGGA